MKIFRHDIINYLIERYNYKSYLEIGVRNPEHNFDRIKVTDKDGVDPAPRKPCKYIMTSDDFFKNNEKTYDIIFIDGLHLDYQVVKDVNNSLNFLNENGTIVMHDCNPIDKRHQVEKYTGGTWNGTVWKAYTEFRMTRPDLFMVVINTDHGVGIVRKGGQRLFPKPEKLGYKFLSENRKKLLNLITYEEFKQMI